MLQSTWKCLFLEHLCKTVEAKLSNLYLQKLNKEKWMKKSWKKYWKHSQLAGTPQKGQKSMNSERMRTPPLSHLSESTPSPCTFPPLVACGSCCVHRGDTSTGSLCSTNTNTPSADWCAYWSKWEKIKKKVYNLNNIMRSLNKNDPRAKCCQKQNTGKNQSKYT